jgi:hypothetical protein
LSNFIHCAIWPKGTRIDQNQFVTLLYMAATASTSRARDKQDGIILY